MSYEECRFHVDEDATNGCARCRAEANFEVPSVRWGHGLRKDTERWCGSFRTRQEAVEAGAAEYGDEPAFYVAWGTLVDPASTFPSLDMLCDHAGEYVYDNVHHEIDDWPPQLDADDAASFQRRYRALLREYFEAPDFWAIGGPPERIESLPVLLHECRLPDGDLHCYELHDGALRLELPGVFNVIVSFCPFCGFDDGVGQPGRLNNKNR